MTQSQSNLRALLPTGTVSFEPLEFAWDGVKEAFIFTSAFNAPSFSVWSHEFAQHVTANAPPDARCDVEQHPDISYLVVNVFCDEKIDVHAAWCGDVDAFSNLNAWLGSQRLKQLVESELPQTAGVVRIEDSSAFFPDHLE